MSTTQDKLAEYRARKKAEFETCMPNFSRPSRTKRENAVVALINRWIRRALNSRLFLMIKDKVSSLPVIGRPFVLKLVLWLILFGLFVELEFGMVFCILSAFVFIYFNTSTNRRRSNELSAYSVFNKNCERLDGTFTAEQFERELRHGPSST
uniref:SAYSvFN domain-containing protein 1 n=1 Tax=Ciona intestinalis TaxID=7719 RepID=UPI000180BE1E|nr:SAYSvFN domain-containing protein 1 [Ciona intestinalis]|eukprot:XP_002130031.1 SAYSvFN domain-containing protein 1 [Ciona intestinalis]